MKKLLIAFTVALAAMALLVSVDHIAFAAKGGNGGGGGGKPGGGGLTCDGSPIEVQITDNCGQTKWVGVTDSATVCEILCHLEGGRKANCDILLAWIGGIVHADESATLGFDFDPATVRVAEVTAEGYQTNLCQISNNPSFYDGNRWWIPATIGSWR